MAAAFAVALGLGLVAVLGTGAAIASWTGVAPWRGGAIVVGVLSVIGVVGVIATALVLRTFLHGVVRPLGRLSAAADRVANGDYGTRVPEDGLPILRMLSRSFNTMTDRLDAHDRLRRDMMADLAHELRTPVTVLQGTLEGVIDGVFPVDVNRLHVLLDETHVLSRLIDDLRTLALAESGVLPLERESTDVARLVADVVRSFANSADARGVRLGTDVDSATAPIDIDAVRIREVLGNLMTNAIRHTPAGGRVSIAVRDDAHPNGRAEMTVEVRDTGIGIAPDDLPHVFDRFHKGPESRGTGLGLAIAKNLVVAHGGEIQMRSTPGEGTVVAFTLPRGAPTT